MKFKLLTFILFFTSGILSAQEPETDYTASLMKEADSMAAAFVAKDYEEFARFTHPDVLRKMGGIKKMASLIKYSFSDFEKQGVKFRGIRFSEPTKIIEVDGELQTALKQTILMDVNGVSMPTETTIVAISRTNGKYWAFIDTEGSTNLDELRKIIPNLSPDIELPLQNPPEEETPAEE